MASGDVYIELDRAPTPRTCQESGSPELCGWSRTKRWSAAGASLLRRLADWFSGRRKGSLERSWAAGAAPRRRRVGRIVRLKFS